MKYLSYALLLLSILYASFTAHKTYGLMQKENQMRYDYAEIHMIKYGLFNLDLWKGKLFNVLEDRIDDFEIRSSDLQSIRKQIERYLEDLYEEYFVSGKLIDAIIESRQGTDEEKKLGKLFVGMFRKNIEEQLKNIDFKAQIPLITNNLMIELERKIPDIKRSISTSVSDMIAKELEESGTDRRVSVYQRYEAESLEETDQTILTKLDSISKQKKSLLIRCLSSLVLGLLILLLSYRVMNIKTSMTWLTIICTVFLAMGLALPMIDLDARLSSIDVSILGENIHFDEQVMYFQSKSIIDVTRTLLEGRGIDLKIVGILILVFSIVLPFLKMLLTTVYLYFEKSRKSKVIKTIIFYMGKWSMADVFVVAIFMSYVGFYGLISSMLNDFSYQSQSSAADTINYSKLSAGIIFFSSYCVLSIIMSTIIHRRFRSDNIENH